MGETSSAQEVFPFPFSEVPEQNLLKSGHNAEYYFSVGDALALQGNITKALDAYSRAVSSGCVPLHRLSTFVSVLMERTKVNFEPAETPTVSTDLLNILTCQCCGSRWADPTTLKCGHTSCRACVEHSLDECGCGACVVCRCTVERDYLAKCKTNILLSQILQKCYPNETVVGEMKVTANRLAARKCFCRAIKAYTEAIKIAPNDLHLRNCRSWTYSVIGLYQNAIEDADLIIKLRPRWAQGYCRRASALRGLSRLEESTQCYLQCLAIDPGLSLAKTELAKVLRELLSQSSLMSEGKTPPRLSTCALRGGRSVRCAARLNTALDSAACGLQTVLGTDKRQHERPVCGTGVTDVLHQRRKCLKSLFCTRKPNLKRSCSMSNFFCRPHSVPRTVVDHSAEESVSEKTRLEKLSAEDFECSLCSSLLLDPITTDCGHVFCFDCLYRSLDYRIVCPLCKESLAEFLAERRHVTTESVEQITRLCFGSELKKRHEQRKQELSLWHRNVGGDQLEIPIFVCTLAYPSIPCPLHVFEPRYRLMIRRCTESGLNQFGMCICLDQSEENFVEFGCLLLIRNLRCLSDGRSVLDTVGGRRFRVLSRGMFDGHHTAKVTYLSDEPVPCDELKDLQQLQMEVHALSSHWFACLPKSARSRILQCYGHFPPPEPDFSHLPDGPSWIWYMAVVLPIGPQSQLKILSMLSLKRRLLTIRHVLTCLHHDHTTS